MTTMKEAWDSVTPADIEKAEKAHCIEKCRNALPAPVWLLIILFLAVWLLVGCADMQDNPNPHYAAPWHASQMGVPAIYTPGARC